MSGTDSPVFAAYNIKNGLYIRPNSPNNNNQGIIIPQNTKPHSRNLNVVLNHQNRLNNTAASNLAYEEEKIEPSPTPHEEYKLNDVLEYRFRNFNIINPVPTEED